MKTTVAALQYAFDGDRDTNLSRLEEAIRKAAKAGAEIILPPELPDRRFFLNVQFDPSLFALAEARERSKTVYLVRSLAKELGVVIPASIFERAGQSYFNTLILFDADGSELGFYRKMHMPLGPPTCYEKFYTSPGDTGFRVFQTAFGSVGAGICWDQWFPESARIMALNGAEILLYPTAIGSDCLEHWKTVMCGHAGANVMPLVASNRVGRETGGGHATDFWGHSFITDHKGAVLQEADDQPGHVIATVDLDEARTLRSEWGVFRDRRPDAYGSLLSLTGEDH